ncbi:amidohydrolase family protein [Aminobacter sp. LjRoot7]|uniref:amidohydrolase family protein n=1 Tax=Aminobacter sp. LjRoot7 TaxID=3342335 RepID=UPI003ECDC144
MLATDASVETALAGVRVSLARQPADLLLANCNLVNVWSEETYTASIAIAGSRIVAIRTGYDGDARHIIDCSGRYVLPGYVESLTGVSSDAERLAATLLPLGVTSIVSTETGAIAPNSGQPDVRRWHLAAEGPGWLDGVGRARLVHQQQVCSAAGAALDAVAAGMAVVLEVGSDPVKRLALLRTVAAVGLETARLMLRHGEANNGAIAVRPVLGAAVQAGIPLHRAVQMAGFNATVQHGIEHDVGSVAPGRLADLLIVDDIAQAVPSVVILDGRIVARDGRLEEGAQR